MGPMSPLGGGAPAEGPQEVESPQSSDRVDLSSTQELKRLNAMAQATPSVRAEKVIDLRESIEDGQYYVESDKLARKVVDDVLTEAILTRRESN